MAIFLSKDKKELIVTCSCGCDNSFHLKIEGDDHDYVFLSYMNGNFYRDQFNGVIASVCRKLHKIVCILFDKDYYYSDVCMSKKDFKLFKRYVNSIK